VSPTPRPTLLSVVVPAYQEADAIVEVLTRLCTTLDSLPYPYEVIVVSDGCTDGTEVQAKSVDRPEITVHHYAPNRGKGYAVASGARLAKGDVVGFIDGDLDIHPQGMLTLLDLMSTAGAAVVVASKAHPNSVVDYPRFRRVQSWVFRMIVRTMFDLDIADTQTGLKVFRARVLEVCLPMVEATGFAFDLELLVAAHDEGFKVTEGPVEIDFQFTTTTGGRAVWSMLRDLVRVQRHRRQRARARRRSVPVPPHPTEGSSA
jgi:glycosyltransferase involved in cell wall biosynthesis